MQVVKQVGKESLYTFLKETKKDGILYTTYDLNWYNKNYYLYNWIVYNWDSFNMQVNFSNKISKSKIHKDSVLNISKETNLYLINSI